ncbi:hypothetical protein E5288_WYG003895 [Bos mutus]|uniref:Plasminogen receptor (KT) n=3 Tax=Bos TaxID=9903 RepID=A0A6B0RY05_9CETA|nr:hypothetical protein [Bos mutus]
MDLEIKSNERKHQAALVRGAGPLRKQELRCLAAVASQSGGSAGRGPVLVTVSGSFRPGGLRRDQCLPHLHCPTEEGKAKKEVKMGFIFSKSMNENLKSQQEFMLMNSRLQLERQLIMQNEMRERQMAMQIAWSREFLKYFGTFFGITAVSLTAGAIKGKKPVLIFPMVPLGFVLAYQYDMGYGTLIHRMKGEAENILETEKSKLQLPKGMITFESLEKARKEQSKFFIDK